MTGWSCPACTYYNTHLEFLTCEICGETRPGDVCGMEASPAAVQPLNDFDSSAPTPWKQQQESDAKVEEEHQALIAARMEEIVQMQHELWAQQQQGGGGMSDETIKQAEAAAKKRDEEHELEKHREQLRRQEAQLEEQQAALRRQREQLEQQQTTLRPVVPAPPAPAPAPTPAPVRQYSANIPVPKSRPGAQSVSMSQTAAGSTVAAEQKLEKLEQERQELLKQQQQQQPVARSAVTSAAPGATVVSGIQHKEAALAPDLKYEKLEQERQQLLAAQQHPLPHTNPPLQEQPVYQKPTSLPGATAVSGAEHQEAALTPDRKYEKLEQERQELLAAQQQHQQDTPQIQPVAQPGARSVTGTRHHEELLTTNRKLEQMGREREQQQSEQVREQPTTTPQVRPGATAVPGPGISEDSNSASALAEQKLAQLEEERQLLEQQQQQQRKQSHQQQPSRPGATSVSGGLQPVTTREQQEFAKMGRESSRNAFPPPEARNTTGDSTPMSRQQQQAQVQLLLQAQKRSQQQQPTVSQEPTSRVMSNRLLPTEHVATTPPPPSQHHHQQTIPHPGPMIHGASTSTGTPGPITSGGGRRPSEDFARVTPSPSSSSSSRRRSSLQRPQRNMSGESSGRPAPLLSPEDLEEDSSGDMLPSYLPTAVTAPIIPSPQQQSVGASPQINQRKGLGLGGMLNRQASRRNRNGSFSRQQPAGVQRSHSDDGNGNPPLPESAPPPPSLRQSQSLQAETRNGRFSLGQRMSSTMQFTTPQHSAEFHSGSGTPSSQQAPTDRRQGFKKKLQMGTSVANLNIAKMDGMMDGNDDLWEKSTKKR